jgi:RimJ/RimL family protein N-acetyltransferase
MNALMKDMDNSLLERIVPGGSVFPGERIVPGESVFPGLAPDFGSLPEADDGLTVATQPTIRTGGLTLRKPVLADASAIAGILANYQVAKMLTRVPQPYHLEDAEDWLSSVLSGDAKGWVFAITKGGVRGLIYSGAMVANNNSDDTLIGIVSIEWRQGGERTGWHLGYYLAEDHWGKGIMSDAANAVIARFFGLKMGETLFSGVIADNPASLRVQEKLGFDVTGVQEIYAVPRAEMVKVITTELTFGGYMPV